MQNMTKYEPEHSWSRSPLFRLCFFSSMDEAYVNPTWTWQINFRRNRTPDSQNHAGQDVQNGSSNGPGHHNQNPCSFQIGQQKHEDSPWWKKTLVRWKETPQASGPTLVGIHWILAVTVVGQYFLNCHANSWFWRIDYQAQDLPKFHFDISSVDVFIFFLLFSIS